MIEGYESDDGTFKFLGIPYAEPPIENLRWKPPVKKIPWEGVLKTNAPVKACSQPTNDRTGNNAFYKLILQESGLDLTSLGEVSGFDEVSELNTSEDCLYLNVIVPKGGAKKKPVMFWIHGGAGRWGSGHEGNYTSSYLPNQGDVIVVTIQYRLGIFGWLAHPELSEESINGVSGNYGTLDQILALEWVQNNISNFGGDPNNVTIFGESAGGQAVSSLLMSPLSKGLFHKAISQSGSAIPNISIPMKISGAGVSAENFGTNAVNFFLGDNGSIEDFRKLPASEIVEIKDPMLDNAIMANISGQIVDGYVYPTNSLQSFKTGKNHKVPYLIGFNANEGTSLLPLIIDKQMFSYFGDIWPAVIWSFIDPEAALMAFTDPSKLSPPPDQYLKLIDINADPYKTAIDLWGEMFFGAPAFHAALNHSELANTYLYYFDVDLNVPSDYLGATHALELGYLFNEGGLFGIEETITDTDKMIANEMRSDWIEFAKNGRIESYVPFSSEKPSTKIYSTVVKNSRLWNENFYRFMSDYWDSTTK